MVIVNSTALMILILRCDGRPTYPAQLITVAGFVGTRGPKAYIDNLYEAFLLVISKEDGVFLIARLVDQS